MLSPEQLQRYARHLSLPGFGPEAQQRLLDSTVLMVGAGGLGSPAALYLAAAGIGRLVIVDDDQVDLSNLQRQILHTNPRQGMPKTESARQSIEALNPDVEVVPIAERFDASNARALLRDCDLVLDGADNFPTRYLINDAAYLENKPVVHGSIHLFEGQCTVFARGKGPCYRCMFPTPPAPGTVPSCAEAGVLGVLPGIIGTAQATEAVKLLTGIGDPLIGRLLRYDALGMEFHNLQLLRNADCPLCGDAPDILEAEEISFSCGVTEDEREISQADFASLAKEEVLLLDVREDFEVALGMIPGSRHIRLAELEASIPVMETWKSVQVICICKSGVRSLTAVDILNQHGFDQVLSLRGGVDAWRES